jgi:hypothetical protein
VLACFFAEPDVDFLAGEPVLEEPPEAEPVLEGDAVGEDDPDDPDEVDGGLVSE